MRDMWQPRLQDLLAEWPVLKWIAGFHMTLLNSNYKTIDPTEILHSLFIRAAENYLHTNFSFERVVGFVVEYVWNSSFCVTRHLHGGRESCHVG